MDDDCSKWYSFCIRLITLIKDNPDIFRFSLEYFRKNKPPWKYELEHLPPPLKRVKMPSVYTEILQSIFVHLQTLSDYFRNTWKWSHFINQFIAVEDVYSKWLFYECISILIYMSEQKRHRFISEYFQNDNQLVNAQLHYLQKEMAGNFGLSECVLPLKNQTIFDYKKLFIVTENIVNTIDVSGVKLPSIGKTQIMDLVLVDSTINNLKALAVAVSAGKSICVCGPVGCGKTTLVQYLASVTGYHSSNRFYQVQLGEEMDSKLLLGTYKCTDVPGEFVWQPGILTKAVINGDWLLFEDIDTATNDVVTLLVSLIERNLLNVPGYRDNIVPAPSFQMFFTQRFITSISGYFQQNSSTIESLRKYWIQVNVEPLSKNELVQLIETKFSILSTIATKMVDVFLLFSVGSHTKDDRRLPVEISNIFGPKGRLTSTRDLLKWCSRSVITYDVTSQESALNVIQNAIDIFCCNVADEEIRLKLACAITTYLGVINTKAEYFCKVYKPKIIMDKDRCIAGRTTLERNVKLLDESLTMNITGKLYFAMTRPACCLMERIACCLSSNEPVLLVGETGTGKTSILQLLAKHTGNTLIVLNMNQQSDSTDLLGGYKPVDMKYVVSLLRNEFEELFRTSFTLVSGNLKFLNHISNCFNYRKWEDLIKLMSHVKDAVIRKKNLNENKLTLWKNFNHKLERLESQLKHNRALAFAFIEGALIRTLKQGHWVLLDEINLASAETLQSLSGLLEENGTISLYEKGDFQPVKRHTNFRLMAAMNPATDVGKKQLPAGIRNRFTEFFVDELTDRTDLATLIACYLRELPAEKIDAIAKFYLKIRSYADTLLVDGTGHKPYYSLRTLCRALSVVAANPCKSIQRSLYEGFCLSFLTQLDSTSHEEVIKLIVSIIVGCKNLASILGPLIPEPEPLESHVCFEGYWVSKGSLDINVSEKYIITPTVKKNLKDLVRVVSLSSHPVLLQGDTSVGKTSLISYLASASGNKCLRINNHEHTDLQEYIGTYSVDAITGQLVFKEGVLVEAMRHGYWIILDELNLAPSDVLEALNRVLDDNRELYIPETQVTVKANSNFRLFATQNPPGSYGGRKILSRAFRNRFIELHFGEIPSAELEVILQNRCDMPASYTKKIVAVMKELQTHRRSSAAFAGKQGFITLRDLFRWGERYKLASTALNKSLYDWDQHIADEGFLVLAGRVRKREETEIVIKVLEKHIKRKVDVNNLFTLSCNTSTVTRNILEMITQVTISGFEHIVWTFNLRKLFVLVGKAIEFQEPVLLVGDTGCGKTTVCQFVAAVRKQKLFIINCHQHSESSDFLGGLRPVRQHTENDMKLFEWSDGPLIEAMKNGHMFLADEISLADDSVLERLNSLLEPERTLLLSEKSSGDIESGEIIIAHHLFFFFSTMNPGGDYGKKELSPALRNRLTEIWCETCTDRNDLISIIEHNIEEGLSFGNQENCISGVGNAIMNFIEWFQSQEFGKKIICSIRDLLLWVKFINITTYNESKLDIANKFSKLTLSEAYIHGAHLVFLDGLGSGFTGNYNEHLVKLKRELAVEYLKQQIKIINGEHFDDKFINVPYSQEFNEYFGIHPFYIKKGDATIDNSKLNKNFTFKAKTTRENLLRLIRALQLPGRAVLLEGSPGVGKTTLVQALANAAGYHLTRINLSEQTDISDLFGADLPVDGADGGVFAWRDGPFLKALKDGHWILLDELNLASQSVLEGLNAVLDHRGELYIPELGRSFILNSSRTRLFACQNPLRQGGGRKGLPASFLNRFTQVYMEPLNEEDTLFILNSLHSDLPTNLISRMVQFNSILAKECGIKWALRGAPWEINLRDLMKWSEVMKKYSKNGLYNPGRFVSLIYADRMRTVDDKEKILTVYEEIFGSAYPLIKTIFPFHVTPEFLIFGDIMMKKEDNVEISITPMINKQNSNLVLRNQLNILRSLAICIEMNWFVILVGTSGSGKTSVVQVISQLCNKKLEVLSLNSAMDTMEILGGFEQVDYNRRLEEIVSQVHEMLFLILQKLVLENVSSINEIVELFESWEHFKNIGNGEKSDQSEFVTLTNETEIFKSRIRALFKLIKKMEKYEYFYDKNIKIQICLEKLETDIQKMGSLNAGGKFEWVDSILVKCLTEGRWLLVENVNLCSPAILDRLNGLLEPGGVLTLGEKGVDNNGDLVTVIPHPNFRLFFTMDPHRGEISRAMRNRGVEISIQAIDESLDENIMDLMAILRHRGLFSHASIITLLEVYFSVRNLNIGLDQVSVGHLIHACFLLVQYHYRYDYAVLDSLKTVCVEVFLKSRSLSYEQQEIVFNVITDTINSTNMVSDIPPFYAALTTQHLQYNSEFYSVQFQGSTLLLFISLLSTNHINEDISKRLFSKIPLSVKFKEYLDFKDVTFRNILTYSLLKFYDVATCHDVKFRRFWLNQVLNYYSNILDSSVFNDLIILNENLSNLVENKCVCSENETSLSRNYLPWDLRRLSDLVFDKVNDVYCNKFSLLVNYTVLKRRCLQLEFISRDSKRMDINLCEYSQACTVGNIPVIKSSDELLANHFNLLASNLDDYFITLLHEESLLVDEGLYELFLKVFQYYNRFIAAGSMLFYSRSYSQVDNYVLNYLRIHFKWLVKWIRKLAARINDSHSNINSLTAVQNLFEIILTIEKASDLTLLTILSFSKKLKRKMGQPVPAQSVQYKTNIVDNFANWITCSNRFQKNTVHFKNYLCGVLATEEVDGSSVSNVPNKFSNDLIEQVDDTIDEDEKLQKKEKSPVYAQYKYPLEIVPVFEAFYLKLETHYKNITYSAYINYRTPELNESFAKKVISQIFTIARDLRFIPIPYITSLEKPLNNGLESKFLMSWFSELLKHSRSFSTFSYKNYLRSRNDQEHLDDKRRTIEHNNLLPYHYPVLSKFGSDLMYFSDEQEHLRTLFMPCLKNFVSHQKMLNQLKELLWKNSAYISHHSTTYLFNERENVITQFRFLTTSSLEVLNTKIENPNNDTVAFQDIIDLWIKSLREFINEKCTYEKEVLPVELTNLVKLLENRLIELVSYINEIKNSKQNEDETQQIWISIGKSWVLMGTVQLILFSIFDVVDPILKVQFQKVDCIDDLEYVRCRTILENTSNMFTGYVSNFPYKQLYENWDKEIVRKLNAFPENMFCRKKPEKYFVVIKIIQQFRNTVGSSETIFKLYTKMLRFFERLQTCSFDASLFNDVQKIIKEGEGWLISSDRFVTSLSNEYDELTDIITPVIYAVLQVENGFSIILSSLYKIVTLAKTLKLLSTQHSDEVQNICEQLCSFPRTLFSYRNIVELCFSEKIVKLLSFNQDELSVSSAVTIKLTKGCLRDFCNVLSIVENSDYRVKNDIWCNVKSLLDRIVYLWKIQEEKREEQKLNEESLYVFKTRTLCENLSEEEENKKRINEFFCPTYEQDFEYENETQDEYMEKLQTKKLELFVNEDEMNAMCSIHSHLAKNFTFSDWVRQDSRVSEEITRSCIVDSFSERYIVFNAVLDKYYGALNEIIDIISLPGVVLMADFARKFSNKSEFNDFYHSSDVEQVSLFYPVLIRVRNHAEELLISWEDHPVLKSILIVVDRILSFEVTSPVSRFLTGADVLLKKLHEWEEVAHSRISFGVLYEELTGLIFMWRKIEISYWKNALENVAQQIKNNTSKWWFHLYSVCSEYIENSVQDTHQFTELVKTFEKFIEAATLGEFSSKLDLLFVFHCHYANQPITPNLRILCYTLWNLYSYYKQFEEQVSAHINSLSSDVRNKLHNFVKITRWNDINYWSVMKTVEKTHEQLMKYIKEFQKILEMPVQAAMNNIPDKNVESCENLFALNVNLYISEMQISTELKNIDKANSTLISKAKKLCKNMIYISKYQPLLITLSEFVESVKEDIGILNKTDIDRTLDKEKQKSQAKNLLQQKRKIVADLFKDLNQLGLSYNSGIVIGRKENFSINFTYLKPFDINQLYSKIERSVVNEYLIDLWKGCSDYFFTSIAKQSQLKLALEKPHQDLGPQNTDRIKGFANYLLDTVIRQKHTLIDAANNLRDLQIYESVLPELITESYVFDKNILQLKNKFIQFLHEAVYFYQQFLILLNCCPENENTMLPTPILKLSDNDRSMLNTFRSTQLWKEIYDKIEHHLQIVQVLKTKFFAKIVTTFSFANIYDQFVIPQQYDIIFNEKETLVKIQTDLKTIVASFVVDEYYQHNVLCSGITKIQSTLENLLTSINTCRVKTNMNREIDPSVCQKRVENVKKGILLCIQKLYKKYLSDNENLVNENVDERGIKKSHMKDVLLKSLNEEFELLNMMNMSKRVRRLIMIIVKEYSNLDVSVKKRFFEPLIPLLNQYRLLAEYTVTQYFVTFKISITLCSSLLSLFIGLTTKGFCIPSELLEDEKEGESSKELGGMGLADEEGIKDVSDQIESQDQLEGAQKMDKQEELDEKDCKEEENGIEMSDDFGGKSYELEKKEGEENNSDGENEDDDEFEKEMGNTGEEAETLDQQIWGDDSENDDENAEGKDSENGDGRGEQVGDNEIGAKDERTKEYEERLEDETENKNNQEKEINEMDDQKKDDDQIDPYHGKQDPLPEPEALDLPEDLTLDEGEAKEDDGNEENPFDIDTMKELMPPKEIPAGENDENKGDEIEEEIQQEDEENNDDENIESKKNEENIDKEDGGNDEEQEENKEDGENKNENKRGAEPMPEEPLKENKEEEEAQPSEDIPSQINAEPAKDSSGGSKDMVSKNTEEDDRQKPEDEDKNDTSGTEQQGVGQADKPERDTKEGHSASEPDYSQSYEKGKREQKRKLKPGESDANRSLAEADESFKKRLKTVDIPEQPEEKMEEGPDEFNEQPDESNLYKHIKEAEKGTSETVDAATQEQAEKQPVLEDKGCEEIKEDEKMDLDEDEEPEIKENISQQKSDKAVTSKQDKNKPDKNNEQIVEEEIQASNIQVEGDYIETMTIERGLETTFHTQSNEDNNEYQNYLDIEYINSLKDKVQEQLANWSQIPAFDEAAKAWELFSAITSNLSQELSEQLRLVLEPTQASRLKGDFRTGRRINMRKVIPYIASQFRKDKIWLRRTKPSKREYQIILAIDDSSSMADNHSKELAFESVALVSKALSLIEAGELGVISFGERTRVIHPLGEPFTNQTGAKLIKDFTFDEIETKFADAVHTANGLFLSRGSSSRTVRSAQLLVIISDGRGVASEGSAAVKTAIRAAKQAGIFIVFIIMENPKSKNSILDIRIPVFNGNKLIGIESYIENFPFPFYLILRDINQLPAVLAEALQQWFELVTNSN